MGDRIVQPAKEKAWGDLSVAFQYLKGTYEKEGEGFSTRTFSDRTRENDLTLLVGLHQTLGRNSLL